MIAISQRLRNPSDIVRFVGNNTGGPYSIKLVVEWQDVTTAKIMGVDKPMTNEHGRALRKWLKANGAERIVYERRGRMRTIEGRQ